MSSQSTLPVHFESVESVVEFLRDSSVGVVSTTTPSATRGRKSAPKIKKEKEETNLILNVDAPALNTKENVQVLSSGRVRYGPITVNPRKQPSKTLFTGRRSKNEVLAGDEEEKRRVRRERNRVAATKCREKRESVLSRLEKEHDREIHRNRNLTEAVHQLQERKQYLLSLFSNQQTFDRIPTEMSVSLSQGAPLVFGDAAFLSSIMETPAPPLPPSPPRPQLQNLLYEEEQASHFRPPTPQLTNSAFLSEMVDPFFATDQQSQQQTYSMNSSSLDRLINELQPPHAIIDSNNLLTSQQAGLYNSAYGTSSCAQQHSSSSEDDSLTPARNNHIVY